MTAAGSLFFGTLIAEVGVDYKVMPRTTRTTTFFPVSFALVVLILSLPPSTPSKYVQEDFSLLYSPGFTAEEAVAAVVAGTKVRFPSADNSCARAVCCHLVVREALNRGRISTDFACP